MWYQSAKQIKPKNYYKFDVMLGRKDTSDIRFLATLKIEKTSVPWEFGEDGQIRIILTRKSVEELCFKKYPRLRSVKHWYVEFY